MRIAKDEWYMEIAKVVALRGTCARRQVGCVLVDRIGRILSTGYNGVARGIPHCIDTPCPGAGLKSGTGLDVCEAIHGESNALLQCRDVDRIHTCYSTTEPCVNCVKLLMSTNCERVVFLESYPTSSAGKLWTKIHNPHTWVQLKYLTPERPI
jgi:dCMP deaminase